MARRVWTPPPIVTAVAISAGGSLPVFLVGSLSIEEGRSLGIDVSHISIVVALFFAAASVGAAVLGHFADRFGGIAVMRIGAAGTCIGSLAASVAQSVPLFAAGIFIAGLGYGAGQPAVSKHLADNVRITKQGIAFGIRQSGVPIATLLAGLAVSGTSGNKQWRVAFVGAASFAILMVFALRNGGANVPLGSTRKRLPASSKAQVGWPLLVLLGASLGLGAGTIYVIASFAVLGARSVGISPVNAGFLLALGGGLALITRVVAGFLADYLRFEPLRVAGIMLICAAGGYVLLASDHRYLTVVGILLAFSVGSGWNALFLLVLSRDFPGNSGKATGIGLAGAYIGGVLGPLSFGFVLSHHGFSAAWLATGLASIVSGVGALFAWVLLRRLMNANQLRAPN